MQGVCDEEGHLRLLLELTILKSSWEVCGSRDLTPLQICELVGYPTSYCNHGW